MGYPQRNKRNVPEKTGCSHAYCMHYELDRAWCDECGDTWQWRGVPRGWYLVPQREAQFGEQVGW